MVGNVSYGLIMLGQLDYSGNYVFQNSLPCVSQVQFTSVTQSCPTLQHTRLLCPSSTSRVCSNSCPKSQWCHLTISPSIVPFSFVFNLSQYQGLFQWVSSSHQVAKVLEPQHQSFQWTFRTDFLEDWLVWSPCSQGTLKNLLQHHSSKASILQCSPFFMVQLTHPYMTTGKTVTLTRWTFIGKVMSLLYNMLSRPVKAFSSKEQASFNFMAAVTICSEFGAHKNKVCHCFHCLPIYLPWSNGTGCCDLCFLNVEF